ncbi:MAG: CoA transferase [Chloroflexi bacterium]|nr:CoA transferase [Chloroflexota bacterium]
MSGPLDGVKVLDFTHTLAGFFATVNLADLGADVLKVEPPTGNPLRKDEPQVRGESAYFMAINRNKRSIVLNLKHRAGREIAQRLADRSDVVVNNFRSTVMSALGLGYEELRARNPRLIYASLSGYGATGPYRERAAYDPTIQAISGMMSLTGLSDGPPILCGVPVGDLTAGTSLAQAVLAALYARERTGVGQRVETSMADALVFYLSGYYGPAYLADGRVYERVGNRIPFCAPYGAFEAADGYLVLVARTDDQFRRLSRALGHEEWADDPRFASPEARLANRDAVERLVTERLRTKTRLHWMAALDAEGVPAGPVNTVGEALSDPAIRERSVIQQGHPRGGVIDGLANPLRFEGTSVERYDASPLFGQHTRDVLRGLGYSDDEVTRLAADGAVVVGAGD